MNRPRIVAAQAVIAGTLIVIVALTILAPDSEDRWPAISTPGLGEIVAGREAPEDGRGERAERRRPVEGGSGAGSGAGSAGLGTQTAPPAAPTGVPEELAAPPGTGPDGGAGDDAPSDDQYADAVGRLTANLD